jgi:K(+)-stimulated pyrophosphate-energized sodium pump
MNQLSLELFAPAVAILGLLYSLVFWNAVKRADSGTPAMQKVAGAISTGARAFVRRQYKTIAILSLVVGLGMILIYGLTGAAGSGHGAEVASSGWTFGFEIGGAFLLGALFSGLSGVVSMIVATKANLKTAAASKHGLNAALQMSLRGGTVSAIVITALSLLGISALYLGYRWMGMDPQAIPGLIVGYGFGASFVALFAQLGGGIYTKAADVGADLVGKIEAGIPEDDPRNPAVVADLVGDNVGDCAGRGADLFESISAENIGAMVLGAVLYPTFGVKGILFPLVFRALGLVASIIGVYSVKGKTGEAPMKTMTRGFWVTAVITTFALLACCYLMLNTTVTAQLADGSVVSGATYHWFFLAGLTGILTSVAFVLQGNLPAIHQNNTPSLRQEISFKAEYYKGVFPHPSILQGFENLLHGSTERIFARFEEQGKHREHLGFS